MEVKEDPGLLKNLIHEFSSTSQNIATVQALILTHEHFVPSEVLLEAIVLEYGAISKTDQASQMRLINILKKWIDIDKRKFANPREGIGKTLNAFITSDELPEHFRKSLAAALSAEASKTGLNDDEDDDDDAVPNVILKKARHKHACFLLCYDAKEIARQMTLIDQQNVANVDLREFLHTSWLKPGQAPTIEKILARADHMAMWIAYELMICNAKKRGKLFEQIVKIIAELVKLKNFQTAMSIYLGLHLNPVADILEEVLEFEASMGLSESWDDICLKLDFSNNYANYREHVKTLTPPMVNIISLFLKDMLYQSEAGPNFTESGEIEKAKLVAMGTLINSFRKCQESPFKLAEYKELQTKLLTFRTDITIEALTRFQHDPNAIPVTKEDKSDSFSSSRSHADRESEQDEQAHRRKSKQKDHSTEEASPKSSDGKEAKPGKAESKSSKFALPMRNLIASGSTKREDRSPPSSKHLASPGRDGKHSPGRDERDNGERDNRVGERPDRVNNVARSNNSSSGTATPEKTINVKKGPTDKPSITSSSSVASSTGSSGGHSLRASGGKKDSVTPEERRRRKELYENSLKEANMPVTTGSLNLKTS